MSPIEKAANNTTVQVLARLSMLAMPIVVALIGWLSLQYLDGRFAEVRAAATQAAEVAASASITAGDAKDAAQSLSSKLAVIEANQNDQVATQAHIAKQVDKLTDMVTSTSVQVSAISATLNAIRGAGQIGSAGPMR